MPSMRTRSITVSSSVGAAAVAQPTATSLLIAGPDLEHSECEIDRIAEVIGDAVVLDARSASVAQVIAAMCEADIVHFACHGTFRSDNPLFSSLHLADGDLTIFELEQCTSLPHTMVLSACNAGQSAVLRGGALLGFASALMQLGLANVVAPLTAVNDEHSVDVMVEFHRRLRQGDDAAGALAAVSANADGLLDPTAAAFSCFGV
jgi:CHAT domain-containing protein